MTDSSKIELTQFLNQQYLCESLTVREIETLLDFTELAVYKKGDVIADIGVVGEALYFVIEGEAGLFYDDQGSEAEIGRVSAGRIMGSMSFFDRQPRSARIRALAGPTRVLTLTRAKYKRLRVEHPYIAVNLLEHAIISLDQLFRHVSGDVARFTHYIYGSGKK